MNLKDFEKIESDLKLDKSEILGVRWWDLYRYTLSNKCFGHINATKSSNSMLVMLKNLAYGIYRLPSLLTKRNSVVILRHGRYKVEEGQWLDIYTKIIELDLVQHGFNICSLENFSPQTRKISSSVYPIFIITFFSMFIARLICATGFYTKVRYDIEKLLSHFRLNDIRKDSRSILRGVVGFKIKVFLYSWLFRYLKPKSLILVVSAGNEAIIHSAKLQKIPTFELQHGSPSEGKLNYDYTNLKEKKYFPDFFLSFGKFFSDQMSLPEGTHVIDDFGYPYLSRKLDLASGHKKGNKYYDLVVMSQPDCDDQIIEFLYVFMESCPPEFRVLVQLHPQYFAGKNPYLDLSEDRIEIKDSTTCSIYDAFSQCRNALTVYSTSIYEAHAFGLNCFILEHDRIKLNKFLELDNVNKIDPEIKYHGFVKASENCHLDKSVFSRYSNESIKFISDFFI